MNWFRERRKQRQKFLLETIKANKEVQVERVKNKRVVLESILSNANPIYGDCPYTKKQPELRQLYDLVKDPDEDFPEPFGLPRGTIRGIITIVMTATFCMAVAKGIVPINIFCYVSVAVILSYFFTRLNLSNLFK